MIDAETKLADQERKFNKGLYNGIKDGITSKDKEGAATQLQDEVQFSVQNLWLSN